MKILSIDCSAIPCSVAVVEDGKVLSFKYSNVKVTHSQTLMPMVESALKQTSVSVAELDGICVSSGPGSFTGIRIGIAAVKGLAAACKTPCVGVSTLLAMAHNLLMSDCIVCAVMDARCNQVYNALFEINGGAITRLTDDRAIMCEDLAKELKKVSQLRKKCVIIVGDGAQMFHSFVNDMENVKLADEYHRYQNAVGVALAADRCFRSGETVMPDKLLPFYLRLPQAERELNLKKEQEK